MAVVIPKRKLEGQKQAVTVNNTIGGDYLALGGGTMRGALVSPVRVKIPVGTDKYS